MLQWYENYSKNLCFYKLKVEWHQLAMNFTHNSEGKDLDEFNGIQFEDFINSCTSHHDLKITDVTIDETEYLRTYESIDDFIETLNDSLRISAGYLTFDFLAISPDGKQKLILHNLILIFFPKYFENWILEPILWKSNDFCIQDYSAMLAFNYPQTQSWTLSDYIYHTLLTQKIKIDKRYGFAHQLEFKPIAEYITTHPLYELIETDLSPKFENNWSEFCLNLKSILSTKLLNKEVKTSDYEQIQKIKEHFDGVEFFNLAYQDFEYQNELLATLPFDLLNRRSTINF